jgi:hypothetical protein
VTGRVRERDAACPEQRTDPPTSRAHATDTKELRELADIWAIQVTRRRRGGHHILLTPTQFPRATYFDKLLQHAEILSK